MTIKTVLVLLVLLFQNTIWSQNTLKELAGFQYKEIVVNASPADDKLPIIIGLHWMRSNPDEFSVYLKDIKSPARILLLQGTYPFKEGFSFYPVDPENYYKMTTDAKKKVIVNEGGKLVRFIASASKKYPSIKKPVIIGASQGGDLSYFIGIQFSSLVGLSCPLLATIDNRLISQSKSEDTATIHAFHGEEDPIVPIKTALEHIKLLKKKYFNAEITTYNGVQHDISKEMQNDFTQLIDTYLK
ncbi:dienelactone hydrolase family protein [Flavobacterium amniphilum]|uniref:alpha/beta hydrolase n=1 Tax=Flavobacterium amniphilum TaxID=1834035 RepID=UPI00202AA814|nr:dienelactone hydrolase family protein [Flavobacterium amniphilum]MCL9805691.1 dienelactone hydrolase family protein [Flavobacterium amniphilum]